MGICLAGLSLSGMADSITARGRQFDGVLVSEGRNCYYVKFPTEGRTEHFPREDVEPGSVRYTYGEKERDRLYETYRSNRRADGRVEATVQRREESRSMASAAPVPVPPPTRSNAGSGAGNRDIVALHPRNGGAPVITSNPDRFLENRPGRSVFVDRTGTPLFTSFPENYRGKQDYVEITIQFDLIEVPARFRGHRSPNAYTTATIAELVRHYARMYTLDEELVFAVIRAESNFNVHARSTAGACGLMQLMPGTAAEMGVTDIFDPAQNIAGGTQYLARMLEMFGNDIELALAAYNAGPGNVRKYGGIPPFAETRNYVPTVLQFARQFGNRGAPEEYLASSRVTQAGFVPSYKADRHGRGSYTIHFLNGWTQPADEVFDSENYYYVTYGDVTSRVPKRQVANIAKS